MMPDQIAQEIGVPVTCAPGLQRVLAPNASPMTHWGTNTYIIGQASVVIIDPGPDDHRHRDALQAALDGRQVNLILVTHSHLDHSGLAPALSHMTGAPVCAFGDSAAGRSAVMSDLIAREPQTGGEGVDAQFCPDIALCDGEILTGDWGQISAVHTPGHMANHMCFFWNDAGFTGDHVMEWASSLVSPPDGDVAQFMRSCDKLKAYAASSYYPGHGRPVSNPADRLAWLMSHRQLREREILSQLKESPQTISQITAQVYADTSPNLRAAAQRNVFAHLIDLHTRAEISASPTLNSLATFAIVEKSEPV